jgi:hypothetical protein
VARGNNDGHIVMHDARIIFRNFAGKEGQFNREGDRNFAVLLDDPKLIKALEKDGWNVKYLKAREEGDEEQPYLQVSVNFDGRPPKVAVITSRGRTHLGEREVEMLDWADIRTCDLIVRPYHWNVNGKTGIKAYLQSLFATIEEDELELKYADIDEVPSRSGRTIE